MQVNPRQYAQAWYLALKEAKEDQRDLISQNLLRALQKQGKLSWLNEIVRHVKDYENADLGQMEISVRSANEIDEKQVQQLVKELFDVENVQATIQQDDSLIGGLVLETKDERWDLSVKHQLDRLKNSL